MDMTVTLAKRINRPWWMTPFGREPLGDVFFDRLWPEWKRDTGEEFSPNVDFMEKDNTYYLTAELPGFNKSDISIEIDDGVLTISGKREAKGEESDYYVKEMMFGSFSRSFRLPKRVAEDKVKATYRKGILTVVIPLGEEEKTRKITVH
jgi:HSP20 family protein